MGGLYHGSTDYKTPWDIIIWKCNALRVPRGYDNWLSAHCDQLSRLHTKENVRDRETRVQILSLYNACRQNNSRRVGVLGLAGLKIIAQRFGSSDLYLVLEPRPLYGPLKIVASLAPPDHTDKQH